MQTPVKYDNCEYTTISSVSPSSDPFYIPVCIQEDITTQAFIDSGAIGNFIHPCFIAQRDIPTTKREMVLSLVSVTGEKFFDSDSTANVNLTINKHSEQIHLEVAPIGKHDIILGLPWLEKHNVQVDWRNRTITGWSNDCNTNCFPTSIDALEVERLSPEVVPPTYATPGSIGADLYSTQTISIPPGQRGLVGTGISVRLPEGTYGRIAPRSGLALKHSIDVGAGVIDPDYRGEVKVPLINNGQTPFTVNKLDCIAQLVLEGATQEEIIMVDQLDETQRGEQGFGHSGMTPEVAEIYAIAMGGTTNLKPIEERYRHLRTMVPEVYHDFLDVFDADLCTSRLPPSRPGYDFNISLIPGAKLPPLAKPYHLSQEETRILKEWIDGMLSTGLIQKCTTKLPTAAPIFFVGKKDGNKRPCVDYRKLNDVTIKNAYPIPRIDQIMDQVKGSSIFSKFDLKSGYNQIRIKEGHEFMAAFVTPWGAFEPLVVGFGQAGAPPFFQKFMNDHVYQRPELVNHVVGYLGDATTYNTSIEEHVQTNRMLFQRCRDVGIFLNPKKCEFHKEKVEFLGVELSKDGFEMEKGKVNTITEWQPPRNVKGVRAFIGFCNFYRRFIKNFAEMARPLHDLTRLGQRWVWSEREQAAFQLLKDIISTAPVLIHPNLERQFRLETDASAFTYGAVLSQLAEKDNRRHPVGFFSKSMNDAERNYGISDREALAVVKALQHWRHWLEGTTLPVEIITDHRNLEYFTKPKILNHCQLRWMDQLTHYNYQIKYRPGDQNGVADALSRRPELSPVDPPECHIPVPKGPLP